MSSWRTDASLLRALAIAAGYLAVGGAVFVAPSRSEPPPDVAAQVAAGGAVWRANNCVSCHSLFGLGGHVGPDLTNVIKWRGPDYVRGTLMTGRPGMPVYSGIPAGEMADLLAYLTHVNRTGEYPQRTRPLRAFGRLP